MGNYLGLGRDEAAAAVIGLRGLEDGNAWLEQRCKELIEQEQVKLRMNRKNNFGCTVTIDGREINRQVGGNPRDRLTDVHWFQNRTGRGISDLSKAMGAYLHDPNKGTGKGKRKRKSKRMPTCWKRSDPGGTWLPVEPATKRSCKTPSHAQL